VVNHREQEKGFLTTDDTDGHGWAQGGGFDVHSAFGSVSVVGFVSRKNPCPLFPESHDS
jgi:hypothetical protein